MFVDDLYVGVIFLTRVKLNCAEPLLDGPHNYTEVVPNLNYVLYIIKQRPYLDGKSGGGRMPLLLAATFICVGQRELTEPA